MNTEKIKVEREISRRVKVSGEADGFKFSGDATLQDGKLQNIEGGTVSKDGSQIASFSYYGEASLNIQFQSTESKAQVLAAVEAFVSDLME